MNTLVKAYKKEINSLFEPIDNDVGKGHAFYELCARLLTKMLSGKDNLADINGLSSETTS